MRYADLGLLLIAGLFAIIVGTYLWSRDSTRRARALLLLLLFASTPTRFWMRQGRSERAKELHHR